MCEYNADNSEVTNWQGLLHEFGLCTLFLKSFLAPKQVFGHHKCFLIRTSHFSSTGPYPIYLTKHFSTLPHPDGSDYLKQKKVPEIFQEIISPLIPFLESIQFQPSFGERGGLCQIVVSPGGLMPQPG